MLKLFMIMTSFLTHSGLDLPLSSHPLQAANCCRNSRLIVDKDDLKWVKNLENCYVLVNQPHGNFNYNTLSCRKIKSVFTDVK